MNYKIKQIRFSKQNTKIAWDEVSPSGAIRNHVDTYEEAPVQAFREALQGLALPICVINEYKHEEAGFIEVTGCTFTHGKSSDEGLKITIIGKRKVALTNSPRNDTTPIFSLQLQNEDDGYNDFRTELNETANLIMVYAEKFLEGDREIIDQLNLFGGEDDGDDDNEPEED